MSKKKTHEGYVVDVAAIPYFADVYEELEKMRELIIVKEVVA